MLGLDVDGMPEVFGVIMVVRLDGGTRTVGAGVRRIHVAQAVESDVENDALEMGAQASMEARMTADGMNVGMIETFPGLEMGRSADQLESCDDSGIEVTFEVHGDLDIRAEEGYLWVAK